MTPGFLILGACLLVWLLIKVAYFFVLMYELHQAGRDIDADRGHNSETK